MTRNQEFGTDCELCAGTGKVSYADGPDDLEETKCPECTEEEDFSQGSEEIQ